MAGLCITEDLFLRIVAHYLPHVRVARTLPYRSACPTLQLVRPDWEIPKTVKSERAAALYAARCRAEDRDLAGRAAALITGGPF